MKVFSSYEAHVLPLWVFTDYMTSIVQPVEDPRGLWSSVCDGLHGRGHVLILEGLQKFTSCKCLGLALSPQQWLLPRVLSCGKEML